MNWLARIFGVCSLALATLLAFFGLILLGGQDGPEQALIFCWIAMVLGALGAVPFVPTLAERPWKLSACVALVYLALLASVFGAEVVNTLRNPSQSVGFVVLAVVAAPGVWLLRRGVGARLPPASEPIRGELDPEFGEFERAHTAPRKVIVAASMLGWSAGLAGLSGLQLLDFTFYVRYLNAAPFVLFAFAAGLGWSALGVYKLRFTQGATGFVLCVVVSLASTVWLVFGVRGGLVTLFGMMLPPVSTLTAALTLRQLTYLRQATEARERLEDQGLSLGL